MFDIDILRIISNNIQPASGKILISEPLLADNIFSRSVVYLVDDLNESHMGFILNLKSGMYLHDALDGYKNTGMELYLGGPVEPDVVHFIHGFGNISDAQEIGKNLYFGGELDQLKEYVNKGIANKTNTKFFLGYSGWSKGQLCEEINNNAWLVADTETDIVFKNEDNLWSKSLSLVDKRYQIWKNFPVNPDLN